MEDKELQQLIEAKLWQLENLRQQEEIASRIGRKKIVWPWWLGTAAAAAILAAVLLSPVLFGGKESSSTPLLIAKENVKTVHSSSSPKLGREMPVAFRAEPCVMAGNLRNEGEGVCQTADNHTPPSALRAATPSSLEGELADAVPFSAQSTGNTDSTKTHNPSIFPTAPRVHTRRSNRLGDIKKSPEKPQVPALIAHYINIPDTVLFTSNIVINLK